jgi:hypothetical protein
LGAEDGDAFFFLVLFRLLFTLKSVMEFEIWATFCKSVISQQKIFFFLVVFHSFLRIDPVFAVFSMFFLTNRAKTYAKQRTQRMARTMSTMAKRTAKMMVSVRKMGSTP